MRNVCTARTRRLEFNFATWSDFGILMFKGAGNIQRSFFAIEMADGELYIAYNFETAISHAELIAPCGDEAFVCYALARLRYCSVSYSTLVNVTVL